MHKAILTAISLAATPAAGEFSLDLPVDCTLGETCYIQQFVDHDPSAAASDFQCGSLTYDGHKGTDFALPSLADQTAGVAVIAAASGRVVAMRNDMPDVLQIGGDAPDVSDRECGNGVVIRHDDGWETQYCHLAEGSVAVVQNQQVQVGDTLGMIGLSGQTQFPHLHLSLRKNGNVVDPFDPDGTVTCDAPSDETLWRTPIQTPKGGVIAAGFAAGVPEFDAIKAGAAHMPVLDQSDPLVVWGYSFGSQPGDLMILTITGPDGEIMDETITLERTQAQLFRAVGRRAPPEGWPSGAYEGTVSHIRDDQILDQQTQQTRVR